MRKFIVFLFLGIVGYYSLGSIPLKLFNTEDPVVKQRLIEKLIELTKAKHPHCEGAYMTFIADEDRKSVDIIVKCFKWES